MVSALLLTKARTWHSHNSCFVDHLHAVDEVRLLALLLGLFDELFREVNAGEAVHGAFDLSARNLLHIVEGSGEDLGALCESIENLSPFTHVLVDASS